MTSETMEVRCCIAGGGPAGMVLGFLLARAGVEVVVLEKHADFLRDFRGDTIHPSTLELMYELGILDDFLRRPHQELPEIGALIDDFPVTVADFSHLPTHCKFVALDAAMGFPEFHRRKSEGLPTFPFTNGDPRSRNCSKKTRTGASTGVRAKTRQGRP